MSERVTIEVPTWVADLFDRGVQAGLVLVTTAAAGFAVLGLAWSGVAAKLTVSLQMPYVVSGGFGGIALAGTCLAILAVHYERRRAASDRADLDGVTRTLSEIVDGLPGRLARRAVSPPQAFVRNGLTIHRADCRMVAGRDLPTWSAADSTADVRPCGICAPDLGAGL